MAPQEMAVATPRIQPHLQRHLQRQRHGRKRRLALLGMLTMGGILVLLATLHAPVLWRFYGKRGAPRGATPRRPATAIAARILAGAKQQQGTRYDAAYVVLAYPNGDVPPSQGACTDVVIRALRNAGFDLQRLIHEDMQRDFRAYPQQWGLGKPDANIDHRRVPNQMRFFARHGLSLPTEVSPHTLPQWQTGDFVYWDTGGGKLHTGVLSDTCNRAGIPCVIHNGYICIEQDCLTAWKIIGHYRYPRAPPQPRRPPTPRSVPRPHAHRVALAMTRAAGHDPGRWP